MPCPKDKAKLSCFPNYRVELTRFCCMPSLFRLCTVLLYYIYIFKSWGGNFSDINVALFAWSGIAKCHCLLAECSESEGTGSNDFVRKGMHCCVLPVVGLYRCHSFLYCLRPTQEIFSVGCKDNWLELVACFNVSLTVMAVKGTSSNFCGICCSYRVYRLHSFLAEVVASKVHYICLYS